MCKYFGIRGWFSSIFESDAGVKVLLNSSTFESDASVQVLLNQTLVCKYF